MTAADSNKTNNCWLIERGSPAQYLTHVSHGADYWTDDPIKAQQHETKENAQEWTYRFPLSTMDGLRVEQHIFNCPSPAADSEFKCPECASRYFGPLWEAGVHVGRRCKGWPTGDDRSYTPCRSAYEERFSVAAPADSADEGLSVSKLGAWIQSIEKGEKRCYESGDAGDEQTLREIAVYFSKLRATPAPVPSAEELSAEEIDGKILLALHAAKELAQKHNEAELEYGFDFILSALAKRAIPRPASELVRRITDYLSGGGLFNPEAANHDAVRDLLIDCRDAIPLPATEGAGEPVAPVHTENCCTLNNRYPCNCGWTGRVIDYAEQCRDYIAALSPSSERSEREVVERWQPISTAPKDGTGVIVFDGAAVGEANHHSDDYNEWRWAGNHPTDHWGNQIYPIVWQPLPAPPSTGAAHD